MLLAEALAERKDVLKRLHDTPARLVEMATWDEDETPADAQALSDAQATMTVDLERLAELNVALHRANMVLTVPTEIGSLSLTEAIALRDRLHLEHQLVQQMVEQADPYESLGWRYRRSRRSKEDVKTNSLLVTRDLKRAADTLAGRIRRLDLAIQQVNWSQHLPD